jgi:hypothetical protein
MLPVKPIPEVGYKVGDFLLDVKNGEYVVTGKSKATKSVRASKNNVTTLINSNRWLDVK